MKPDRASSSSTRAGSSRFQLLKSNTEKIWKKSPRNPTSSLCKIFLLFLRIICKDISVSASLETKLSRPEGLLTRSVGSSFWSIKFHYSPPTPRTSRALRARTTRGVRGSGTLWWTTGGLGHRHRRLSAAPSRHISGLIQILFLKYL